MEITDNLDLPKHKINEISCEKGNNQREMFEAILARNPDTEVLYSK